MYPNLNAVLLSNEQHFRLNKINEIKDYFVAEVKERKLMSKRLSKYIFSFDYFDKLLIVLSVTTGSISIALFATVIEHLRSNKCKFSSCIFDFYRNHKKAIKNKK